MIGIACIVTVVQELWKGHSKKIMEGKVDKECLTLAARNLKLGRTEKELKNRFERERKKINKFFTGLGSVI